MQAGGGVQYGVPEVSQFMVARGAPAQVHNIFAISQSPSEHHQYPSHHHHQQQQKHHNQHHQQQQQQQHKIQMVGEKAGVGADSPELPSPIGGGSRPVQANISSSKQAEGAGSGAAEDDVFGSEDFERGGSAGNRWPRQETLALLKIRSEMDATFRDASLKGPLWEHVSRRLEDLGYHRSAKKCKEKFENLHKYYKRTKEGRIGRQDGKSYRFFSQLEALYAKNNKNPNTDNGTIANVGGSIPGIGVPVSVIGQGEINRGGTGGGNTDFSNGMISLSSESSEDDYDESRDAENRKRKRSSTKKMMAFFEKLMKEVVEKQEKMQQQFLEAIEKREQDRMIREEAWKRQEMARLSKDRELRAQERSLAASRDLALVSFLQKLTGQTLQLNDPQIHPQDQDQEVHEYKELSSSTDPNSKRWPKPEVHALIRLRSEMGPRFHETGPKGPLWEEISAGMACLGYNRSAKRCKEKWENINKYFKKAKESNKKRPENAKTCPYFHQLDALYRRGILHANANKVIKMNDQGQDHQEELLEQGSGSNREDSPRGQGAGDEDSPRGQGAGDEDVDENGDGDGDEDGEILAIMPPPDSHSDAPNQTPTSNGVNVATFFSNPENGNADDRSLTKGQKREGLMKGMMDMQPTHQHDESVLDGTCENQKMELIHSVMNNLQDKEKQKQANHDHLHSSTSRDASFMEIMVQKLTADPPEFTMSTSSQ